MWTGSGSFLVTGFGIICVWHSDFATKEWIHGLVVKFHLLSDVGTDASVRALPPSWSPKVWNHLYLQRHCTLYIPLDVTSLPHSPIHTSASNVYLDSFGGKICLIEMLTGTWRILTQAFFTITPNCVVTYRIYFVRLLQTKSTLCSRKPGKLSQDRDWDTDWTTEKSGFSYRRGRFFSPWRSGRLWSPSSLLSNGFLGPLCLG
jgi:hypothetical protein